MSCHGLKEGETVLFHGRRKKVAEIRTDFSDGHHEVGVYDLGKETDSLAVQYWSYFSDKPKPYHTIFTISELQKISNP